MQSSEVYVVCRGYVLLSDEEFGGWVLRLCVQTEEFDGDLADCVFQVNTFPTFAVITEE
jgi:hypothetical protein